MGNGRTGLSPWNCIWKNLLWNAHLFFVSSLLGSAWCTLNLVYIVLWHNLCYNTKSDVAGSKKKQVPFRWLGTDWWKLLIHILLSDIQSDKIHKRFLKQRWEPLIPIVLAIHYVVRSDLGLCMGQTCPHASWTLFWTRIQLQEKGLQLVVWGFLGGGIRTLTLLAACKKSNCWGSSMRPPPRCIWEERGRLVVLEEKPKACIFRQSF